MKTCSEKTHSSSLIVFILFFIIVFFNTACPDDSSLIVDFMVKDDSDLQSAFVVSGLFPSEGSGSDRWRWAMGPSTTVYFYLNKPEIVRISIRYENPFPGQSITFKLNGNIIETIHDIPKKEDKHNPLVLFKDVPAQNGKNILELNYDLWNHKPATISEDNRSFALKLREFKIRHGKK